MQIWTVTEVFKIFIFNVFGWRPDIMLQLYWSLGCFKLDYGGFVYGSAMKYKLSAITLIYNVGIHLATDAFCLSCLENLYVRFGESSLDLQRNILQCFYGSKLTTEPHHLSHATVFHPTLCTEYDLNITISWPVGVCLQQLLQWLDTCLLHIILQTLLYSTLGNYPPNLWSVAHQMCERHIFPHLLLFFAELLSTYMDCMAVYTGRTFAHDSTGSAFMYYSHMFLCHNFNSVFAAEPVLYTELFCPSGIILGNIVLSAWTLEEPCQVWMALHLTIPSLLRFWFKCSTFTS
jgi:hypothetical protein